MNREQFLEQVQILRGRGKSIRAIAAELGVHRSRVERGLKSVARTHSNELASKLEAGLLARKQSSAFIGRQPEIDELRAALEEAYWGRGRLIMLVGEPGVGKTRVAQELAAYAGLRGADVIWGRCYEREGAPPFWP